MNSRNIEYLDTPIDLRVGGRRCRFAPMRMEWGFDGDAEAITEKVLELPLEDPSPTVLQIQVTQRCNLRCRYCTTFNNPLVSPALDLADHEIEMLRNEIRALPPHGLVILSGGEPLLVPEVVGRLLEPARVKTVMFTNGTVMTEDALRTLRHENLLLLLSADGPPSITRQRRSGGGDGSDSDRVFEAMRVLREARIPFGISMVLGAHNWRNIEAHVASLHDLYHPTSFGVSLPHFTELTSIEPLTPEQIADAYLRLLHLCRSREIYVDQIARRLQPFLTGQPKLRDCSACGSKRVFFPGGVWRNCANQQLTDAPLDIWSHRIPVRTPSCHGCLAIGHCGGGCIFDAERLGGPANFDPRHCSMAVSLTRAFLELCAGSPSLQRTDRSSLARLFPHLLHRKDADRAARVSVGHASG